MSELVTTKSVELVAAPEESSPSVFMARVATLFAIMPDGQKDKEKCYDALMQSIEQDSRITSVEKRRFDPNWSHTFRVFPYDPRDDDILTDRDEQRALLLGRHIRFVARVPYKNQPKFRGADDFPSEAYDVCWDGIFLVVVWKSTFGARIPSAGGHVVIDILREAGRRAGMQVQTQGCSAGCTFMFMHNTLTLEAETTDTGSVELERVSEGRRRFVIHAGNVETGAEAAALIFRHFGTESISFARFKNLARRIRTIDKIAHQNTSLLLRLNYEKSLRRSVPILKRRPDFKATRKARSDRSELTSGLWLALIQLETLTREWLEVRTSMFKQMESHGTLDFFETDLVDDDIVVESLETELIRTTLENVGSRSDNRIIAFATAAGALAAVVGGFIGAVIH